MENKKQNGSKSAKNCGSKDCKSQNSSKSTKSSAKDASDCHCNGKSDAKDCK